MTEVVPGSWESPTPREQGGEARHNDVLDFVIAKVEADPEDVRALKDVCFFACRSRFKSIRERVLKAIEELQSAAPELGEVVH